MAKRQTTKLVYEGSELRIEFYQSTDGEAPACNWL